MSRGWFLGLGDTITSGNKSRLAVVPFPDHMRATANGQELFRQ